MRRWQPTETAPSTKTAHNTDTVYNTKTARKTQASTRARSLAVALWTAGTGLGIGLYAPRAQACGPCVTPSLKDVVLVDGAPLVVTNFGLIQRVDGGWKLICEETIGGLLLTAGIAESGFYVSTTNGAFTHEGEDTCSFVADHDGSSNVWFRDFSVAVDADMGPMRYGLVIDAKTQDIHVERARPLEAFQIVQTLTEPGFDRVVAGGKNPAVYVTGYTYDPLTWYVSYSLDAGDTWDTVATDLDRTDGVMEPVAVDPLVPEHLYASLDVQDGAAELWRFDSSTGELTQVATLPEGQRFGGLSLGEKQLYFAGRDDERGSLFSASRDDMDNFELLQSDGPRFSCIKQVEDGLLACVNDFTRDSQFILGSSPDDGKTWSPVLELRELAVVQSCGPECSTTTAWLYANYGGFSLSNQDAGTNTSVPGRPTGTPKTQADSGVDGEMASDMKPKQTSSSSGCSCVVGTTSSARFGVAVLFLLASLARLLFLRQRVTNSPVKTGGVSGS